MYSNIRELQLEVLKIFGKHSGKFALAGGTALELYYLKHRFSRDLDFFSPDYDIKEVDRIISVFNVKLKTNMQLKNEFILALKAKVRFYIMPVECIKDSLKIDFVEDVLIEKPNIRRFNGIPVYDVKDIYLQKIIAITGSLIIPDIAGREKITGRGEIRDVIDLYYLSKKIKPLHKFVKNIPGIYRRGLIEWYRTYSRHQFMLEFLDYELYDKKLDGKEIIAYLDKEVNIFVDEEII